MAGWEFATLTTESAHGTATASPVLNADYIALRLDQDTAVSVFRQPVIQRVRTADTRNALAYARSERYQCPGRISTLLYATHAPLLLKWALVPMAGGTTPWTSSIPAGNLPSMTLEHAYEDVAGTLIKRKFTGGYVLGGRLAGDNQSDFVRLELDVQFSAAAASTVSAPAASAYPSDPYTFQDSSGGLTIGGSVVTSYTAFEFAWQNRMALPFDEAATVQRGRLRGRDATVNATLKLKNSPDRRGALEALTAQTMSLVLNNGTNSVTFNFGTDSVMESIQTALPLGDEAMELLAIPVTYDVSDDRLLAVSFT